jgi:hypothetical protein
MMEMREKTEREAMDRKGREEADLMNKKCSWNIRLCCITR